MSIVFGLPMASASEYPNRRCAAAFQLTMIPFRFLETIASLEESTMAACLSRASNAR